jgi:ATP-dependent helicase/nuclease subunit B
MGYLQAGGAQHEIDVWLRDGGMVVTASERAARSILAGYHRSRRSEGLTAWPAPDIQSWPTFVRSQWAARNHDGRLALNLRQEQALWTEIVARRGRGTGLLEGPRRRLAALAVEAHQLICDYAPRFLGPRTRLAWQGDAEVFSAWLEEFEAICKSDGLISPARLPLELVRLLEAEGKPRPPILLAGFDRVLPTQQTVFTTWNVENALHRALPGSQAPVIHFYETPDQADELAACAAWSMRWIAANPRGRLVIIARNVAQRRGEYERAFRRIARADGKLPLGESLFEFSLGVPLGQLGLARSALHLLRWLTSPLAEHEIDWLFSSGYSAAGVEESRALTAFMRAIRRKGWQRIRWTLTELMRQRPGAELPAAWTARMTQAQQRLLEFARSPQTASAWAELVPRLLELTGWPGSRPLRSAEFQALTRWDLTVDECATLGFDGRRMDWQEFLSALDHATKEVVFAAESHDAPILISGPAESAGLTADAIWFLGADEDNWPARGATHPFLPISVQREAGMPHASPRSDWDLAEAVTRRLLGSAPEVHFSYARQADAVDLRPSPLVVHLAGSPRALPRKFRPDPPPAPITIPFPDQSRIPFPAGDAPGGAGTLTLQSQCAFRAFATARLAGEKWELAEAGLNAAERGLLLHEVLHSIWAGPPGGIRTHRQLAEVADLGSFVSMHVHDVLTGKMPARARESMPRRYRELEEERLIRVVTEWLRFEQTRIPFDVRETELSASVTIAGLNLLLRLDRVDRLVDGSQLVLDYKSGNVSPKMWELPRPEDVQLPLYAAYALHPETGAVGGLAFARIRANQSCLAGRMRDACATLTTDLGSRSDLVKKPLTQNDIEAWRGEIERLAREFLAGNAAVDPRSYPETCQRCGLQALCRIQENARASTISEQAADSEAEDD